MRSRTSAIVSPNHTLLTHTYIERRRVSLFVSANSHSNFSNSIQTAEETASAHALANKPKNECGKCIRFYEVNALQSNKATSKYLQHGVFIHFVVAIDLFEYTENGVIFYIGKRQSDQ